MDTGRASTIPNIKPDTMQDQRATFPNLLLLFFFPIKYGRRPHINPATPPPISIALVLGDVTSKRAVPIAKITFLPYLSDQLPKGIDNIVYIILKQINRAIGIAVVTCSKVRDRERIATNCCTVSKGTTLFTCNIKSSIVKFPSPNRVETPKNL